MPTISSCSKDKPKQSPYLITISKLLQMMQKVSLWCIVHTNEWGSAWEQANAENVGNVTMTPTRTEETCLLQEYLHILFVDNRWKAEEVETEKSETE